MSKPRDPRQMYKEACAIAASANLAIYEFRNTGRKCSEVTGYRVLRKNGPGRMAFLGSRCTVAGLLTLVRKCAKVQ